MIESTLFDATKAMSGTMQGSDRSFRGVSTDTRSLRDGQLFFALQGPNFDGGGFLAAAEEKNAAAAVVPATIRSNKASMANIAVADTRLALGRLAAAWRQRMPATLIGVTGSNGKTTVKEMISSCLSQSANTLATRGNLNNDIGVPLMLLELDFEHRYAIIEMGANHAGEIGYLASLASPEITVITNAAPAHLEGFGSVEGVAHAKAEILQGRTPPRVAVLNADDPFFGYWCSIAPDSEIISFGTHESATVSASKVECSDDGSTFVLHIGDDALSIELPLPGVHNVMNACAAAAVALALEIGVEQIRSGLDAVQPVAGRLQSVPGAGGISLYDDSYNANPTSVIAAARFLATLPGKSGLVLGDMGELGSDEEDLHRQVGAAVHAAGVDRLFATGELCRGVVDTFGSNASWHESVDELIDAIREESSELDQVLVKGSRFMRMERVVDALGSIETGSEGA